MEKGKGKEVLIIGVAVDISDVHNWLVCVDMLSRHPSSFLQVQLAKTKTELGSALDKIGKWMENTLD